MKLPSGMVALTVAVIFTSFAATQALGAGTVGTGSPASCTEAALDAACATGGTVTFNCGASPVTITVTAPITIATGKGISPTSIDGGGLITLSGGGSVGVLVNPLGGKLTVSNLTITDAGGTGINNSGKLTVTTSSFSNNSGGAIGSDGKTTVTNSTFASHNTSAIGNGGKMTVSNSTFSGNSSPVVGGGAIFNFGTLKVTNSTFSDNSGTGNADGGGAIFSCCSSAKLTVTNSTFSGNSANVGLGGAISTGGKCTVKDTLFANSTGGSCAGTIKDGGHNLDDSVTCGFKGTGCSSPKGTSLCNAAPDLDSAGLVNNGGPTQTIAVDSGSAAIGAATCSPKTDQRGYARAGAGNPKRCTIGAYEFNSPGCPPKLTACGALNVCTNIMSDGNNCGGCGHVCGAGQKCSKGMCK